MTSEGRDRSVTAVTTALPRRGSSLAHRADPKGRVSDPKGRVSDPKGRVSDPEGRVSEKWIRFSAPNDALIKEESIGSNPKRGIPLFSSDALGP